MESLTWLDGPRSEEAHLRRIYLNGWTSLSPLVLEMDGQSLAALVEEKDGPNLASLVY